MRLVYRLVGVASLALAVLGAFLPLLPTTCFVLLSAWCFARSSPKWHARMMENKLFGGILKQWQRYRCMPVKIKWVALASICLSGGYSLWLIEAPLLQLLMVMLLSMAAFSVLRIRQCPAIDRSGSS